MKTKRQLAAVPSEPRPPKTTPPQSASPTQIEVRVTRRRSLAWDPYEVWKTRVKGENSADDAEITPAA